MARNVTFRRRRVNLAKDRSPTYPQFGIEAAIKKARQIYEHAKGHAVPPIEVHKAWGYSSPNGPGLVAISTLKEFDLLVDEGRGTDRTLKLSGPALQILRDDQEVSGDRTAAICAAAFHPKIFNQLLGKYGRELPANGVIETELKLNRGFSDKAAPKVVEKLRQTLAYCASLGDPEVGADTAEDIVEADFEQLPPEHDHMDTAKIEQSAGGIKAQFNLSLKDGGRAAFALSMSDPISAQEAALIRANVNHALDQCGAPPHQDNSVLAIED